MIESLILSWLLLGFIGYILLCIAYPNTEATATQQLFELVFMAITGPVGLVYCVQDFDARLEIRYRSSKI